MRKLSLVSSRPSSLRASTLESCRGPTTYRLVFPGLIFRLRLRALVPVRPLPGVVALKTADAVFDT
jgi:hypothetical protein